MKMQGVVNGIASLLHHVRGARQEAGNVDRGRQESSEDHAGSDAKPAVGTRCSLRPEMSTVNSEGPALPPGSPKNITTRPYGAHVGPSLWNPEVSGCAPGPSDL